MKLVQLYLVSRVANVEGNIQNMKMGKEMCNGELLIVILFVNTFFMDVQNNIYMYFLSLLMNIMSFLNKSSITTFICNIINVFSVTFNERNMSLLNKLFQK